MSRCLTCGKTISKGRMVAMPGTETCVLCSRETPTLETEPGVVDGSEADDLVRIVRNTTEGERR